MSSEVREFVVGQHKIIFKLLREELALNLIFLIGSGDNIDNKWSRLMLESDSDDDRRYKYWRHEPVTDVTMRTLHFFEKSLRGVTLAMLNRVETIDEDPAHFRGLVDRGHATTPACDSRANKRKAEMTLQFFDMPSKHSDTV
jgi:hypothetical protein